MKTRTISLLNVWLVLSLFGTPLIQTWSQDLQIVVQEFRNVRVQLMPYLDRTAYWIDYESRTLSLKMDGSMGDPSLSSPWGAANWPDSSAAFADLYRWLEGKKVYSGLNNSQTDTLFNFYKAQGFKFGEIRTHTELGTTLFFSVFLPTEPPKEKPAILSEPQPVAANPGDTIFFAVSANGTEPLTYEWRKNGVALQNGGRISGATSTRLTISSVIEADKGSYSVVVRNSEGSVISLPASLEFDAVIRILSFTFNSDEGGLDFIYESSAETKEATTVEFHWATGTTLASKLSAEPVFKHDVPARFSGRSQKIHIPGSKPDPVKSQLWNAPDSATHLLLVIDPENKVSEFQASKVKAIPDVLITYGPGVDSSRVSAWTLQAMRDIYRVAGHKLGVITSLARTPQEQAEIMFKQMRDKEISDYGVGGEAVKNVYTTKVKDLDPVADSAKIIEAMHQEVLTQESAGNKVSNHIADSCVINAVDVGRNDITARYGIAGRLRFLEAACVDNRKSRLGGPGGSAAYACFSFKDPTYHLDFPLPPDVAEQCRANQGSSLNIAHSLPSARPKIPAGYLKAAAVVPIEILQDSGIASGSVDSGRAQFTFAANEGDFVSVFVRATTILLGSKSRDADSMLYLLDENATVIASNDDPEFGELSAALETVRLPQSGDYTFIVTTFPNAPVLDANGKIVSWPDNGESKIGFDLEVELRRKVPMFHTRTSGEETVIEWDGNYILHKLQANQWTEVSRSAPYYLPAGENLDLYRLIPAPEPLPVISQHPASLTVGPGASASFQVAVAGPGSFEYQWRRDGAVLSNNPRIQGVDSARLSLENVSFNDAGQYVVVVKNSAGSATSQAATLTVAAPPGITTQPQSRTNIVGTPATLSVFATGTSPLSYQWRKGGVTLGNGGNISGANTTTLTLANVQTADGGNYDVVVTNNFGSVTSQVAALSITQLATNPMLVGAFTNGGFQLHALGAPISTWQVLRGPKVLGPWTVIGHIIVDRGAGTFFDMSPPPEGAFYRVSTASARRPDIPDGYLEWYKADSAQFLTLSDGQAITNWLPEVGSTSIPTTIQDAGSAIVFRRSVAGLNGMPALEFAGGRSAIRNIANIDFSGLSIFLVFKNIGSGGLQRAVAGQESNTLMGPWHPSQGGAYNPVIHLAGVWKIHPQDVTNWSNTNACVLSIIINSTDTANSFINGVQINSVHGTQGPMDTSRVGRLAFGGGAGTYNEPYKGYIAEFIVYRRALTGSEIVTVHNYLRSKYGLE